MENLIKDNLDLCSSEKELHNESDNESDNSYAKESGNKYDN